MALREHYSLGEKLLLRPLIHRFKLWRYDREDAAYSAIPSPDPGFAAALAALKGRDLAVAIAFNHPWAIGWQARLCARNLRDAAYVIADNSTDAAAARAIRAIADQAGATYFRLPANPYGIRHASRSHGLALNWAYRNIVRPLKPPVFAVLDHDMFPLKPVSLAALVRDQPIYGRLMDRPHGWYLWAGFAVFRWADVADVDLDFRQDWFNGLDTGGANYRRYYHRLDRDALRFAHDTREWLREGTDHLSDGIDHFDDWVHLGNASQWWEKSRAGKDKAFEAYLAARGITAA